MTDFNTEVNRLALRSGAWRRSLDAFVGAGRQIPSDLFSVSDEDAAELLEGIELLGWGAPMWRWARYAVRVAHDSMGSSVGLFHDEALVGLYEGSCLWIAPAHRGKGLSAPLILAAAQDRGGSVLPAGVEMHGYSLAGLAAHEAAWTRSVEAALAAGKRVPADVRCEWEAFTAARARAGSRPAR